MRGAWVGMLLLCAACLPETKVRLNYTLGKEATAAPGEPMIARETIATETTPSGLSGGGAGGPRPALERFVFREELLYAGHAGTLIHIRYREYGGQGTERIVRPAYDQSIDYDLAEGAVFAFRVWRVRVLKADNLAIQFVVESDGSAPAEEKKPAEPPPTEKTPPASPNHF